MKKILIIGLFVLGLGLSPILAQADKIITDKDLPKKAQTFASKHFAGKQIAVVKLDNDLLSKSYEVLYNDGTKVEYNSKGEWKEVSVRGGAVPAGIVPSQISKELKTRFPQQSLSKIERTRSGYEVELSDDTELIFSLQGEYIRTDY